MTHLNAVGALKSAVAGGLMAIIAATTGQAAELDGKIGPLSASYQPLNRAGDNFYYNVTLTNNGPNNIKITGGKRCYSNGDCYDRGPSFTIPAGESVPRINQSFETRNIPDKMTYTYYGTDENGNPVQVSFTISTNSYK